MGTSLGVLIIKWMQGEGWGKLVSVISHPRVGGTNKTSESCHDVRDDKMIHDGMMSSHCHLSGPPNGNQDSEAITKELGVTGDKVLEDGEGGLEVFPPLDQHIDRLCRLEEVEGDKGLRGWKSNTKRTQRTSSDTERRRREGSGFEGFWTDQGRGSSLVAGWGTVG